MNYSFSSSHDGKVIETKWMGTLTGATIAKAAVDREIWIEKNIKGTPLILISNYVEAELEEAASEALSLDTSQFREIENKYPKVHWISIMPFGLRCGFARMWQIFADEVFTKTHVFRSRDEAEELISSIITGQKCG